MVNIRLFLFFFKKENIYSILFFFSLASLLFIGDIFFLVLLMRLIGTYLAFSLFFLFSALGHLVLFRAFVQLIDLIKTAKERGEDCMDYYFSYAGMLPPLVYLIYPGVISTLVGFIFLIPPVRRRLGEAVSQFLELDWDEVNEYLFLLL